MLKYQMIIKQKGEMFIWSHPFDFHFKVNELSGWYSIV